MIKSVKIDNNKLDVIVLGIYEVVIKLQEANS